MYIIDENEIEAVRRVFNSKKLFRYQRDQKGECDLFEEEFSTLLGIKSSLMVTSGTNAIKISLAALGIGRGDEVLIPAYTFVATAVAVLNAGATPVVVNINEQLYLDLKEAKEKINSRTKAIIIVHMDGMTTNMNAYIELAKSAGIFLIEDCAQSLGGGFLGKRLGTWGDVGCFSFNMDKNITCGEGGAVVTNSLLLYKKIFNLHDPSTIFNPITVPRLQGIIPEIGESMRVSEISGAIMREQLKKLDMILSKLRATKYQYASTLDKNIIKSADPSGECATSLHLILESPEQANLLGKALRDLGFAAAPPSMRPAHVVWKWMKYLPGNLNMSSFLQSLDIISRIIKLDIRYDETEEGAKMNADKIKMAAAALGIKC